MGKRGSVQFSWVSLKESCVDLNNCADCRGRVKHKYRSRRRIERLVRSPQGRFRSVVGVDVEYMVKYWKWNWIEQLQILWRGDRNQQPWFFVGGIGCSFRVRDCGYSSSSNSNSIAYTVLILLLMFVSRLFSWAPNKQQFCRVSLWCGQEETIIQCLRSRADCGRCLFLNPPAIFEWLGEFQYCSYKKWEILLQFLVPETTKK